MNEDRYGSEENGQGVPKQPPSVTQKVRYESEDEPDKTDVQPTSVTNGSPELKQAAPHGNQGGVTPRNRLPEPGASGWTLEGLGGKVSEMLGELEEKKKAQNRRISQAQRDARSCGICGKPFRPGEVIWRGSTTMSFRGGQRRTLVPMCDACRSKVKDQWWDHRWLETEPCESCGRTVRNLKSPLTHRRYVTCSEECRLKVQKLRESERRALDRLKVCGTCREPFEATRSDARYCSSACRQKAYRRRTKEG